MLLHGEPAVPKPARTCKPLNTRAAGEDLSDVNPAPSTLACCLSGVVRDDVSGLHSAGNCARFRATNRASCAEPSPRPSLRAPQSKGTVKSNRTRRSRCVYVCLPRHARHVHTSLPSKRRHTLGWQPLTAHAACAASDVLSMLECLRLRERGCRSPFLVLVAVRQSLLPRQPGEPLPCKPTPH